MVESIVTGIAIAVKNNKTGFILAQMQERGCKKIFGRKLSSIYSGKKNKQKYFTAFLI
jgi:hypothetical protein